MEFGKTDLSLLGKLDLSLPEDGYFTRQVLPGVRHAQPRIFAGAPLWANMEWKGIIYPEKLQSRDTLAHYVRHFGTIELNATHYKIHSEESTRKWAKKAYGHDFFFCPKFPQSISHYSDLSSPRALALTDEFLAGIQGFGAHLGPCFLQLSEKFGPSQFHKLHGYLARLPQDLQLFVEVRHRDWYADISARREFFGSLHNFGFGAVITDTCGRRDCVHMELPIPKAMVRFVGNGKHPTDFTRLNDWVERLHYWISQGLEQAWFFIHQPEELFTPEMAIYFSSELKRSTGITITTPQLIQQSSTLFG